MSTLSELIPSGGTQNNIEFVAQGTLANGQTVALRSDGKVEAVSIAAQAIGTAVVFEAAAITQPRCSYNPDQDITLVTYEQNSRIHCVAVKVNGSSMTIGTPIEPFGAFSSFGNDAVTFDSNRNQHVLVALNNNGSNHGFMVIVTASGTSLTATGKATLNSSTTSSFFCAYDPTADRTVVGYRDGGNSSYLTCVAITNSGSSLSVGSKFVYWSNTNSYNNEGIYSPVVKKVACSFRDGASANTIMMYGFTITGTTPSYYAATGNLTAVTSGQYPYAWMSYDSTADRFILGYTATSDEAHYATAVQWSGSSFIAGTAKKVSPSVHGYGYVSLVFDPDANITYYSYRYNTASYQFPLTVSGSTITVGTSVTMPGRGDPALATYDTTNNKVIYGFADGNNGNYGTVQSFTSALSNASSFIGITNAAISSGATGEVAVKGGLSTTADLGTFASSAGSATEFAASDVENQIFMTYDTTNNKVIVVYQDSIFKAVVGTVSGTGISFGSPVTLLNSGATSFALTFDVNAGKLVAIYGPSSNGYATAVIGTVSGTSISFGTPVVWASSSSGGFGIDYDAVAQKVLIAYHDGGSDAKAIVGTVSGTSISFGSAAVFVNYQSSDSMVSYDVTANKSLIIYQASNSGYGIVATISGTSVSFGSSTVITTGQGVASSLRIAYDSSLSKHGFLYKDDQGYHSRVATVSGTSVSFGAIAALNPQSGGALTLSITYDTSSGAMLYITSVTAGSSGIFTSVAKISGTDLIFPAGTQLSSGFAYQGIGSVYDPDSAKVVIGREDNSDNYHGYSQVITITGDPLAIGSNYFVQDDGTLATTSSSNKAGKAISTTALNLVDPT